MKTVVIACLFFGVATAMPQFQLGVQPNAQGPSRGAPSQRLEEQEPLPPQPYTFGLEVNDDEFTNYQTRQESQDENGFVQGHYSYVAPNGVRYTVNYTADPVNGFQAKVTEEQTDIIVRNPQLAKETPEHRSRGVLQ